MTMKFLAAAALAATVLGAQARLPEVSAAAAPTGSFLAIAADAGQQVSSAVNGDATAKSSEEQSSIENTGIVLTPVPEPETYALMLAGIAAMGFVVERGE